MKKSLMLLVVLGLATGSALSGGFILREENDYFSANGDEDYTQGLELLFYGRVRVEDETYRLRSYGFRNLMYTPGDISIEEPQPDDRPWAGLSALVVEDWCYRKKYATRVEWVAGVVGEWSQSDEIQAWVHNLIGATEPEGWENQIPSEVFVNVVYLQYRSLWEYGQVWSTDVTGLFGGALGTAFVDAEAGVLFRMGYRIPRDYSSGIIKPTAASSGGYGFLFAEPMGRFVVHNVMLGGSLFQDGPSRELEPFVGDFRWGGEVGYDVGGHRVRFSYSIVNRSPEFEKQQRSVSYGSLALSYSVPF